MGGDGWDGIPADVFSEILLCIPPCARRRLRLVCRHWRGVIDERAPEPRSRPKVLAFFGERRGGSRAVVFDDDALPGGGKKKNGCGARELGLEGSGADAAGVRMIGTCNGLICVLRESGGNVAVLNAAVREMVDALPPHTWPGLDASTYTFGYHAETGRYKVVHVPCDLRSAELAAVYVFTLGAGGAVALWKEVAAPAGSGCLLRFGLVTIGGVAYWVTKDGARIMAFDLGDETFAPLEWPPMPVLLWMDDGHTHTCHLTEVRGRLGLVVRRANHEPKRPKTTEVWVLEGESAEERAWVKSFTVEAQGEARRQEIALPHVAHGNHVLTTSQQRRDGVLWLTLNAHRLRGERKLRCGVARVGATSAETRLGEYDSPSIRTFAYVETREPVW
ncbi:unnamed protein product [Urochloa decumbens]|uniref:F-box domain-containing protein n=1 Tax=Urochloa decumbens TaxID=240449 RepID=A0ABC8W345_9POAL